MGVNLLILQNVYRSQDYFPQFLFSQLTSRLFCLALWQRWFIEKLWVAIVLAFPQMPLSLRLRHKLLDTLLCSHPRSTQETWTFFPEVRFLGVLPFLHPPAISKMMALTDLSLPGWDGNTPSWKQLIGLHLPTVDFAGQHLGALISSHRFLAGCPLHPQTFCKQLSEWTSELGHHYCSCGPWHCLWWVNSLVSLQSCPDFSSR